jgi:putative DNA primase/helicase
MLDNPSQPLQFARKFIARLLEGQIPLDGLDKTSQSDFGEYTAQIASLLTIAKKEGLTACISQYIRLLATNPELNIAPYPLEDSMSILTENEVKEFDEQPITAIAIAEFCNRLYADTMCYTDSGRWLAYTGGQWIEDERVPYQRMIKAMRTRQYTIVQRKPRTDETGNEIEGDVKRRQKDLRTAIGLENYSQDSLVKNLRNCATRVKADELDANPHLLGVNNGVVDLRTGHLCPPNADMLITRFSPIRYNPNAPTPKRWLQFLNEIFAGNEELIEFMALAIGYALTGFTSEQCFFVLHGNGANGKSTLISVLSHVLGSYAMSAPFNTFEHGKETSTGNDLARLNGARAVFTSEVSEGSRFNAQRVKALTGEDEITARYLFKEFFTYRPRFKVFMAVNHKPTVRDDSEGFWRRVRLIPFTQSFMGANADSQLEDKLLSESEAILAWCVKASRAYIARAQKHGTGLTTPQAVMVATQAYRNENDILGLFLDEKCTKGINASAKSSALYEAYRQFADENGLHALSNVKFSQALQSRGLRKERQAGAGYIVWRGVGLLADEAVRP